MHQSNGQVERYCRTVMNMIRVETNFRQESWSSILWKLQLNLNITLQKSTQCSPLNLLIGSDSATPVIRSVVRDVAYEAASPNRESLRELARQRASGLLEGNRAQQDARVNERRRVPQPFRVGDRVFVRKTSQSTGKLDSGMRGPYSVTKILPEGRYELRLVSGSYGKSTQAAAQHMMLWRGEWTPDVCAAFFECAADEVEDDFLDSEGSAEGTIQEVQSEVHTQPSRPRRMLPEDAPVEDEPTSGTAELAEE